MLQPKPSTSWAGWQFTVSVTDRAVESSAAPNLAVPNTRTTITMLPRNSRKTPSSKRVGNLRTRQGEQSRGRAPFHRLRQAGGDAGGWAVRGRPRRRCAPERLAQGRASIARFPRRDTRSSNRGPGIQLGSHRTAPRAAWTAGCARDDGQATGTSGNDAYCQVGPVLLQARDHFPHVAAPIPRPLYSLGGTTRYRQAIMEQNNSLGVGPALHVDKIPQDLFEVVQAVDKGHGQPRRVNSSNTS